MFAISDWCHHIVNYITERWLDPFVKFARTHTRAYSSHCSPFYFASRQPLYNIYTFDFVSPIIAMSLPDYLDLCMRSWFVHMTNGVVRNAIRI